MLVTDPTKLIRMGLELMRVIGRGSAGDAPVRRGHEHIVDALIEDSEEEEEEVRGAKRGRPSPIGMSTSTTSGADTAAMGRFRRERVFRGAPVDIWTAISTCLAAEQLEGTLAKHFAGQTCLMIAEIDLTRFGDAIRWEESRGGELFPHLYAELHPIHAVVVCKSRVGRRDRTPSRASECRRWGGSGRPSPPSSSRT